MSMSTNDTAAATKRSTVEEGIGALEFELVGPGQGLKYTPTILSRAGDCQNLLWQKYTTYYLTKFTAAVGTRGGSFVRQNHTQNHGQAQSFS